MVTRDDIAKRANVSSATVSRVINGSGKVSPELYKRVMDAIEELGYTPNRVAKSLRCGRTFNIAYIVPDITNPYYTEIFRGINKKASQSGYMAYLLEAASDGWFEFIKTIKYDGIICSVALDKKSSEELLNLNIPVVLLGLDEAFPEHPNKFITITHSVYNVFINAFENLYQSGHREIGVMVKKTYPNSMLNAYRDVLERHGSAFRKHNIIEYTDNEYHYNIGYKAMEELISKNGQITAVVTDNDLVAIGAMAQAVRLGYIIPRDISFLGCNDTVAARYSNPPLSTIKLYKEKQGIKAAELLINIIEGNKVQNYTFQAELILRDSIVPPRLK